MGIVDYMHDLLNPMIDSSHSSAMSKICDSAESQRWLEDGYEKPQEYYGILDIGVHPTCQRRGIARSMLQWGLERAEKQSLPVHLSATPAGVPLYHSLGFYTVGTWTWRRDQDSQWEIMRWDPVTVRT